MGFFPEYEKFDDTLAGRLLARRQEVGLTLEEVAQRTGISRATLSRIERGDNSPTANTLGRLCSTYKVTMSQLLLEIEDDAPRLIPRSAATTWSDPQTGFMRTAISPPARGYDIELVWGELPPGATVDYSAPPSQGMEQHIVLFDGNLILTLGDDMFRLGCDDCLRMKLHGTVSFQNPGRSVARYLVAIRRPD